MATLMDIAKEVGTSVAVVSKVLNKSKTTATVTEEVRKKILAVAKKLGYHPNVLARGLVKGKTYTIGVLLTYPSPAFLSSFLAFQIISGVWDRVRKAGYSIFLKAPKAKKAGFFPSIDDLKGRVDGIIAIGPVRGDDKEVLKWNKIDIPLVLIGTHPGFKGSRVDYDNEGGAYLGTKFLLLRGHKRIGLIGIGLETSFMEDRLRGYKRALFEKGVEFSEELVKLVSWRERDGYISAMELLSLKERPTAIFITIGEHIRGVCQAVREMGLKIPDEVELLSFDRLPEDWLLGLPLLSLNTSLYKLGLFAARKLLRTIEGKTALPQYTRLTLGKVIQIGEREEGDVI